LIANRYPSAYMLTMPRQSMKEFLLIEGLKVVHRHGFNASGVKEITEAAGVPKGSFYNHFKSKDDFAVALVERYWCEASSPKAGILQDEAVSPGRRLILYFAALGDNLRVREFHNGCLMGNLSLELADQCEIVRVRLSALFAEWTRELAACIEQARLGGELTTDMRPDALAAHLINSWEGAVLRARVDRSSQPFDDFQAILTWLVTPRE